MKAARLLAAFAASTLSAAALFSACVFDDRVAGGSSEVDNPIVVAFINASGEALEVTGSLSVYLADQNPSVDPEPILRKQLAGAASVRLTGADFTQGARLDTSRAYNLLLLASDSSGALLREVSYDPRTGRYTTSAGKVTSVKLAPAPLVRYASTLSGIDSGVVRVYVPGTPYQTVLVDSQFVFEGIPSGDLPFHVVLGGAEVPLVRDSNDTGPNNGPRHHIDSTKPPRQAPPPQSPDTLRAHAGPDVLLYLGNGASSLGFSLNGDVIGVDPGDPRLAVLWKQVNDSAPRVPLTQRASRSAKTTFTESGAYRFVFSASFGEAKSEDTVLVTVQPAPDSTVFSAPAKGFVLYLNEPFQVSWYATRVDTLTLQFTPDTSALNWQNLPGQIFSKVGMNTRSWTPQGEPSSLARLRLLNKKGSVVAVSQTFSLTRRAPPPDADEPRP